MTTGPELRADCSRCVAWCCVIPPFSRSADFAFTKPAGVACTKLDGHACSIHDRLRESGFGGCVVFDCFGAGQHLTENLGDWRTDPTALTDAHAAFWPMLRLHELAWYLTAAAALPSTGPVHVELTAELAAVLAHADAGPAALAALDLETVRSRVNDLLLRVSAMARAGHPGARDLRGAVLVGKDLAGHDLRGASLRGAVLLGADLRGAMLQDADLTGADLRGADLRDADLGGALFVTAAQLTSARGDATTRLPDGARRPDHW